MPLSDPLILAVASPPGRSMRGIVRLSGRGCFDVISSSLRGGGNAALPIERGMHRARLALEAGDVPVIALLMPAPHSYTGEDCAELQLPGNPALLDRVMRALLQTAGKRDIDARQAEPGEFTARAYLGGRLSLTEAEGVAATIAAQSDAQLRAASMLRSGALGLIAHRLADELASALALVEAEIDFTDQEDVVAIMPDDLLDRLRAVESDLAAQLERAVGSEQLEAIPWVVLTGAPNAGKSTLFNALLGCERAVVADIPGTTRDVITEPLAIPTSHGRAEVMLVDLAGLDADPEEINQLMQARAREAIDRAELILHCVPLGEEAGEIPPGAVIVRTKADSRQSDQGQLYVSAATGAGLRELRDLITQTLADRAVSLSADALALGPRHELALREAQGNLREAITLVEPARGARQVVNAELVAASMRAALNHLGALAGDITPDDVLGRIFASFCVGK